MIDLFYLVLNLWKLAPWITIFITCEMLFIQTSLVSFLHEKRQAGGHRVGGASAHTITTFTESTGGSPVRPVNYKQSGHRFKGHPVEAISDKCGYFLVTSLIYRCMMLMQLFSKPVIMQLCFCKMGFDA